MARKYDSRKIKDLIIESITKNGQKVEDISNTDLINAISDTLPKIIDNYLEDFARSVTPRK